MERKYVEMMKIDILPLSDLKTTNVETVQFDFYPYNNVL